MTADGSSQCYCGCGARSAEEHNDRIAADYRNAERLRLDDFLYLHSLANNDYDLYTDQIEWRIRMMLGVESGKDRTP